MCVGFIGEGAVREWRRIEGGVRGGVEGWRGKGR